MFGSIVALFVLKYKGIWHLSCKDTGPFQWDNRILGCVLGIISFIVLKCIQLRYLPSKAGLNLSFIHFLDHPLTIKVTEYQMESYIPIL